MSEALVKKFATDEVEKIEYLYGRWQDEKEYEDFQEYIDFFKRLLEKYPGIKFLRATKSPFVFHVAIGAERWAVGVKSKGNYLSTWYQSESITAQAPIPTRNLKPTPNLKEKWLDICYEMFPGNYLFLYKDGISTSKLFQDIHDQFPKQAFQVDQITGIVYPYPS